MTHLEDLIAEYYEWRGYVVKCNALVGKRPKGGWEMELDVVAYDPVTPKIFHLEPSLDAQSWEVREGRFIKKFEAGRKYILTELFKWLPSDTPIVQKAILVRARKARPMLAGAEIQTVDEIIAEIKAAVMCRGVASRAAIPEHYPLLRTIQFVVCGYHGLVEKPQPPS
jgi:hypothetical protein